MTANESSPSRKPSSGHACPNAVDLRPGVDDECDLPEPFARLSYTLNMDSQHDCDAGFGHHSDFCKHAVWREVKAHYRAAESEHSR